MEPWDPLSHHLSAPLPTVPSEDIFVEKRALPCRSSVAMVAKVADVEALSQPLLFLPLAGKLGITLKLRGVLGQDNLAALFRQLARIATIHHVELSRT